MYASQINAGNLGIYDVTDKQNITLLATQQTPKELYPITLGLTMLGDVVFTTDEKKNAPVAAYDISDLNDIIELDQFRPVETLGENVIPHNVHVWEDWLIISYYTDGGIIADASRPENIIEVGNWDTFLGGNGGFKGVWGAYPFLPSGLVLLTDIKKGLFVCGADYVRACWLEGKVTNLFTGVPVFAAEVSINSPQANFATSDLVGNYETGQAIPGTFDVTFTHPAYYPKTVPATLENGVLTILDVELEPITNFDVVGHTVKKTDGSPAPNALIYLDGIQDYTIYSDADGNFTFDDVDIGDYKVYAGGWGYLMEIIGNFTVDAYTGPITIELSQGYQDDFFFDLGWTATGDALTGLWERGTPIGTTFNNSQSIANPAFDIQTDFGDQCYMTGNAGGDAGDDDVDNGTVTLTSPPMDLTGYGDPVLSYNTWFVNDSGIGGPNDTLEVRISNGVDEVVLESISNSQSFWNAESTFHLANHISLTDSMQVIFETSDFDDTPHLVEAAVDAFEVVNEVPYPPFSASQTVGCLPYIVEFTDISDSTTTYLWTFEGGNPATSDQPNPSVEYTSPGIFNVTLEVVTDSGNVYTISRPNHVRIGVAPTAGFIANVSGEEAIFTNNSSGGGIYFWDFGDEQSSTDENPVHSYDSVGVYAVSLVMANECGTDTLMQDIEILAIPPTASFNASEMAGCTPFIVEFTDQSEGVPESWAWTFLGGDPATSTEQHPVVTYNTPGTWSVELIVTNAAGVSTEQQSQVITVGLNPTAEFDYTANGLEATFVNASSNGNTYTWTFGDGTISNDMDPAHTYPDIGEYDVTLTVENECGIVVFSQIVVINSATAVDYLDEMDFQISLAPNPFADRFVLNYDLKRPFDNAYVAVYNVLGQQVSSVQLTAPNGRAQMGSELSQSGVYLVHLVVDGKVGKVLRVVKLGG